MNATARSTSRIVRGLAAASLITALAAGCQFGIGEDEQATGGSDPAVEHGKDPAGDGSEADQQDPQASDGGSEGGGDGTAGSDEEDAVVDDDAAAAGVDLSGLGEPVATAEIPATVEGNDEATMTVELFGLERRDDTVVATFAFTVNSDTGSQDARQLYHFLGNSGWHPYAIDAVNLNKHGVLGGAKVGQTDYQSMRFKPGQTFYAYASFAAPPEDVTAMDVMMVDGAPMATGVEIR